MEQNGKMIHLLVDCSFGRESAEMPSGIEVYTGRLLRGLNQSNVFHTSVLMLDGMAGFWEELAGCRLHKIVVTRGEKVSPSVKTDRLLRLVPFAGRLRELGIDVVLTPYYHRGMYIYPKRYHQHVVVHDLFYKDDDMKPLKGWKRLLAVQDKWILRHVPYVISISHGTQKALKEAEGVCSDVVYNSLPLYDSIAEEAVAEVEGRRYILDVNRFSRGKNVETLIRAFALVSDRVPHLLYLKGLAPDAELLRQLKQLTAEMGVEDRVVFDTTNRKESELKYLYAHADLFVTPSLREGFGFSPLEAASLGTPVIISDIEVLREVTCNKFPFYPPQNHEALADLILQELKTPLSATERQQLAGFFRERYSAGRQIAEFEKLITSHLRP